MEEIIKAVAAQTGLSPEISRQAVQIVISQIMTQLPKPVADQIGLLLGGNPGQSRTGQGGDVTNDVVGSVLKGLGGILGGKS